MQIELTTIRDVYREVEKETAQGDPYMALELIRKDMKSPWMCRDITKISEFEPAYNENGRRYSKRTNVVYDGTMRTISMSYEDFKAKLDELTKTERVGFGTITT